mmetsp:Transcript_8045/g.24190  ORF Transcript_8045/g.24190 Transcript_8045/m.24190 type:complete len:141 (+) Transcript_8045:250-672(+)
MQWQLQAMKISMEASDRKFSEQLRLIESRCNNFDQGTPTKQTVVVDVKDAQSKNGSYTSPPLSTSAIENTSFNKQFVRLKQQLAEKDGEVVLLEAETGRLREELGRQQALVARLSDEVRVLRRVPYNFPSKQLPRLAMAT